LITEHPAEKLPEIKPKRVYEKPQLTRVSLVPEEAVLAACKAQNGWIDAWAGDYCGRILQCFDVGS
jgi:hypothetical protein